MDHITERNIQDDITLPFASDSSLIKYYQEYISTQVQELISSQPYPIDLIRLPLISSEYDKENHNVLIKCLAPNSPHFSSFLLDMISKWLIPEHPLTPLHHSASQIKTPSLPSHTSALFTISFLQLPSCISFIDLQLHLEKIKQDIQMGSRLSYDAKNILELKGSSADDKISKIHRLLNFIINRKPLHFSKKIYRHLHGLMAITDDNFFLKRSPEHLVKIIAYQYYFANKLQTNTNSLNDLDIKFKFTRTFIEKGSEKVPVLGLIFQFLSKDIMDQFNSQKFIDAISIITPTIKVEGNSYFFHRMTSNQCSLYLEVANTNYRAFSKREENLIITKASNILKSCIEQAITSIIMPSNEEELMRYVILLAQQIQYKKDIPQVYISLDEQTATDLFFSVVLVRPILNLTEPIKDLIKKSSSKSLHFELIRKRITGMIDTETPKEASILRCKLQKRSFIRSDRTLNLNKARKVVYTNLTALFGPIRDYIGGLIDQQHQQLSMVEAAIPNQIKYSKDHLESFFYAIRPASLRSIFPKEAIIELFLLCNKNLRKTSMTEWKQTAFKKATLDYRYWVIILSSFEERSLFISQLQNIDISFTSLIYSSLQLPGRIILGIAARNTKLDQDRQIDHLIQSFSTYHC